METLYEVGSSDNVVNHSERKRERTSPGEGRARSAWSGWSGFAHAFFCSARIDVSEHLSSLDNSFTLLLAAWAETTLSLSVARELPTAKFSYRGPQGSCPFRNSLLTCRWHLILWVSTVLSVQLRRQQEVASSGPEKNHQSGWCRSISSDAS